MFQIIYLQIQKKTSEKVNFMWTLHFLQLFQNFLTLMIYFKVFLDFIDLIKSIFSLVLLQMKVTLKITNDRENIVL